jgi:predicted DNA binding protein
MYPSNKYSDASVLVKIKNAKDFMELKNKLTNTISVKQINRIINLANVRNNHLKFLNFTGIYGDTIATILYENKTPSYWYFFVDGIEHWDFIARSKIEYESISEKIEKIATIKSSRCMNIAKNHNVPFDSRKISFAIIPYLTNLQSETILMAYRQGYYDIPKKITIKELSQLTGQSPSTIDLYLRNSEKKIMDFVLKSNDFIL